MAVDVLTDDGMGAPVSAFYCTTSGRAFGPTMKASRKEVLGFQIWLRDEQAVLDERLLEHDALSGHWCEWERLSQSKKDACIEAVCVWCFCGCVPCVCVALGF